MRNYFEIKLEDSDKFDNFIEAKGGIFRGKLELLSEVVMIWGHPNGESAPNRRIVQSLRFPIESSKVDKETIERRIDSLKSWWKAVRKTKKIGGYKDVNFVMESRLTFRDYLIYEVFYSLRGELEQAVIVRFGKDSYVSDFSDKEVIVGYNREAPEGPSYQTDKYTKIGYKFKKGEITFVGTPKEVERKTTYEGIEIDGYVWATLTLNEKFLRDKAKEE